MTPCNNSSTDRHREHHPDAPLIITSILSVLGLPGNVLVIILIWRAKQKRSTTTWLLLSLAIADIVNLLGVDVFQILVSLVEEHYNRRKTILLLTIPPKIAANFTLAVIALERYNALVKAMKSCMNITRRKILIGIVASWLVGLALSTTMVVYGLKSRSSLRACPPRASPPRPDSYVHVFWSLLLFLGYVIPLVVVVFCYASIFKGLYFDGTILGETVTDETRLNQKKALVRVLLVVTSVFVMCNVPAIIILMYKKYRPSHGGKKMLYHAVVTLGCLSSFLNPFVYGLQSENCRSQVKELLCKNQENENGRNLPIVFADTKL